MQQYDIQCVRKSPSEILDIFNTALFFLTASLSNIIFAESLGRINKEMMKNAVYLWVFELSQSSASSDGVSQTST